MNTDIRIPTDLPGHPKMLMLAELLDDYNVGFCLIRLWLHLSQRRSEDGNLAGYSNRKIAIAAGYRGDPDRFVDALVEIGFLVGTNGAYEAHEWCEHQPYASGATERSERARKGGLAKQRKHREQQQGTVPDSAGSRNQQEGSNGQQPSGKPAEEFGTAPSPDPAPNPNPSPSPSPAHERAPAGARDEDEGLIEFPGDRRAREVAAREAALPPAPPANEGFRELAATHGRLARLGPILDALTLHALREMVDASGMTAAEINGVILQWEAARKKDGKAIPNRIAHPNYWLRVVQEFVPVPESKPLAEPERAKPKDYIEAEQGVTAVADKLKDPEQERRSRLALASIALERYGAGTAKAEEALSRHRVTVAEVHAYRQTLPAQVAAAGGGP